MATTCISSHLKLHTTGVVKCLWWENYKQTHEDVKSLVCLRGNFLTKWPRSSNKIIEGNVHGGSVFTAYLKANHG